jgi:hypothetical protein
VWCNDETMELAEEPAGWTVPISGFAVYQIEFGGRVAVCASGRREGEERSGPLVDLIFNGHFTLRDSSTRTDELDAEGPWDLLTPLFALRHCRISSGIVTRDGSISVEFEEGFTLTASSGGPYENWEVVGPRGLKIVGLPGGGEPAIFGGRG